LSNLQVLFSDILTKLKRHYSPISTSLDSVYLNTNELNCKDDIDAENWEHVSSLMISIPRIEDQPELPLLFL
jgi:hypothetical protein